MKPPTRVWIENSEGEVVTKVEVDGYTVIDKLYLKSDVDEVNWRDVYKRQEHFQLNTFSLPLINNTQFLFL